MLHETRPEPRNFCYLGVEQTRYSNSFEYALSRARFIIGLLLMHPHQTESRSRPVLIFLGVLYTLLRSGWPDAPSRPVSGEIS